MNPDYELAVLAATQAGFLSLEQVTAKGLTPAAIRWRLEQGVWTVAGKGLYHVLGLSGDHLARARAAAGILRSAVISHETAAELHRIPYLPRGLASVTVHNRTTHVFPGVVVHRTLDLTPDHYLDMGGHQVTTPARTLVDVSATCHPKAVALAVDEMVAARVINLETINDVFCQVARKGRKGCGPMRTILEERIGDPMVTASRLEKVGMAVFERGGLPAPVWQYPAPWDPECRIDFAWPPWWVGVEGDSRRWHTRVEDFERDRERDRLALLHRWWILRFTWNDFVNRPDEVVAQVRAAIDLRRNSG
ncbi:MAG: type IV toxin-antitoxin system AbiEi family antitoxin domain-containing protein [Acidimicrobiia bacterium]